MGVVNSAIFDLILNGATFKRDADAVNGTLATLQQRMDAIGHRARRLLAVGGGLIATTLRWGANTEAMEAALDAALVSTGHSLEEWSRKLKNASTDIQKLTVHGDEFTQGLMAQLLNLGVTADKIDDATRASIGLATALGQDLKAGVRNYALALAGNFTLLGRYIPGVRLTRDVTEKLRITQELAARGFEQAKIRVETFSGRLIQLKNDMGDLAETVGLLWAKQMTGYIESMRAAVPALQEWVNKNGELLTTIVKITFGFTLFLAVAPRVVTTIKAIGEIAAGLILIFGRMIHIVAVLITLMSGPIGKGVTLLLGAIAAGLYQWYTAQHNINVAVKETNKIISEQVDLFKKLHAARNDATNAKTDEARRSALEKQLAVQRKLAEFFRREHESGSEKYFAQQEREKAAAKPMIELGLGPGSGGDIVPVPKGGLQTGAGGVEFEEMLRWLRARRQRRLEGGPTPENWVKPDPKWVNSRGVGRGPLTGEPLPRLGGRGIRGFLEGPGIVETRGIGGRVAGGIGVLAAILGALGFEGKTARPVPDAPPGTPTHEQLHNLQMNAEKAEEQFKKTEWALRKLNEQIELKGRKPKMRPDLRTPEEIEDDERAHERLVAQFEREAFALEKTLGYYGRYESTQHAIERSLQGMSEEQISYLRGLEWEVELLEILDKKMEDRNAMFEAQVRDQMRARDSRVEALKSVTEEADKIREGLKNREQLTREEVANIRVLEKLGLLSREEADAAEKMARARMTARNVAVESLEATFSRIQGAALGGPQGADKYALANVTVGKEQLDAQAKLLNQARVSADVVKEIRDVVKQFGGTLKLEGVYAP